MQHIIHTARVDNSQLLHEDIDGSNWHIIRENYSVEDFTTTLSLYYYNNNIIKINSPILVIVVNNYYRIGIIGQIMSVQRIHNIIKTKSSCVIIIDGGNVTWRK